MRLGEELKLLIKSKYPLVYVETIDENYVRNELQELARELGLVFYQWSITTGLLRCDNSGSFYKSKDPAAMVQLVSYLAEPKPAYQPGLFLLTDFHKYLDDNLVLRGFKDLLNRIKNTKDTVLIVAPEYKLPAELESLTTHIIGGYPDPEEIDSLIGEVLRELIRNNPAISYALSAAERQRLVKTMAGLSLQQIRNILTQVVLDDNRLDFKDLKAVEAFKKKSFDQQGLLEFCAAVPETELVGFNNLKNWLQQRRAVFAGPGVANLPSPKGVLLMGVQGCGKSLAVKVIANALNLPLYRLDLARLYSSYIGQTEQNLRQALQLLDKFSPLCLWIDEIEKGFAASDGQVDGGVSQRILGSFLTWMQERKSACFIAATANNVQQLPPEFLRKGRFDEVFFVDLPTPQQRQELFRLQLQKRGLAAERFDLADLAGWTNEFSGAEIEQVVIAALYQAANQNESLTTNHLLKEIKATKPLAVLKAEEVALLREWARERTVAV